jgi:hypothetical protein
MVACNQKYATKQAQIYQSKNPNFDYHTFRVKLKIASFVGFSVSADKKESIFASKRAKAILLFVSNSSTKSKSGSYVQL